MKNLHFLFYKQHRSFMLAVGNWKNPKKMKLFFGLNIGITSGMAIAEFRFEKCLYLYLYFDLLNFKFSEGSALRFGFKMPIFPNLNYKKQVEQLGIKRPV